MRHRVALARLDARELAEQLFLDRGRARELFRHALHLALALGDVAGHLPRRLEQAREAALLFGQDPLFALHALEARKRLLDFRSQHRELRGHRQQLVLQRVDPVELVLGISDERAQRVDLRLDGVDFGAARELIAELALDVGQDAVESVDASFDLLHELQPGRHAVQLAVELARQLAHARGFLRALFDEAELGLDGVHLRLDLRRARVQHRDALDEALERRAIGAELVAQLRGLGVRLVEVDDLLLQRLEIAPALVERHELRVRALGELVHLVEPGMQRLERLLLLVELVALREQLLVPRRQRVDALVELRDVLVSARRATPCALRLRRPTPAARAAADRRSRTPSSRPSACRRARESTRSARGRPSRRAQSRARARPSPCVAESSWLVVSAASFSMRARFSSVRAICLLPSFSLAICESIDQTSSFSRLASTTAWSIVCFWLSSAFALCVTCSASALSDVRRSSVFLLSSCSCASGPMRFSTSFTASIAAPLSSRASRDISRMRA